VRPNIVRAADAVDLRPIGVGRNDHAAGALDRLADEGGNVLGTQRHDLVFQLAGRIQAEFRRRHLPAIAVPIGRQHMGEMRHVAGLAVHIHHAAGRRAQRGRAVIAVFAPDHDLLVRLAERLPVHARHAQRGIHRLGS
jgi:hypothetical protein